MLRKNLLLLIAICVFLLGVIFFLSYQNEPPPQPIEPLPQQILIQEDYKKIRDEFIGIADNQSPKKALLMLSEKIKTDKALARSCHALTHELGQHAYQNYKDFGKAMQYQNEICNSGYLHGIIESNFVEAKNIFATMQTVCHDYLPTSFVGWECYHGVGHGLMYFTKNDLPQSVSLCEEYKNQDARDACINGVFMENFSTDQKLHLSLYLKRTDPFYPCPKQNDINKTDCYLYAPTYFLTLHQHDYRKAFNWCMSAEKNYFSVCIVGVGSQMIKDNINDPKQIALNCTLAKEYEHFCITGIFQAYINHFGRLEEARELCEQMEKRNQSTCKQVITSRESMFLN